MRPGTRRNQRRQPQPARARPSAARPAAIRPRLLRFPPCWAGLGKPGPFRRPACGHPAPAAPLPALLGRFREARPLPPPGLRLSYPGGCASRPVGPAWGSPAPFAARPAAIRPRWFRFPPCWAGLGKPGPFRRPACGHPAPAAALPALLGRFREAWPLSPPGLRPSGPGGSVSRLVGRVWGSPAPSAARPAAIGSEPSRGGCGADLFSLGCEP